jgi:hypothetical protein
MDAEAILERAAHAVDVAEVVDRRAARVDAVEQRREDRVAQRLVLRSRERTGGPQRVNPRAVQGLVGVDVADPRDAPLVEQEGLDRGAAPPRERVQVRGGETRVERLDAEASREELVERGGPEHELAGPEAPRVDDHEALAARPWRVRDPGPVCRGGSRARGGARPQLDSHAHMRGLGPRLAEHGPGHAQVLDEMDLVVEMPHEVLAAPRKALDPPPAQRVGQFMRLQRPRPARVQDLDGPQAPALHERRELASDRLDLGQLGHGAQLRADRRATQRDARGWALK